MLLQLAEPCIQQDVSGSRRKSVESDIEEGTISPPHRYDTSALQGQDALCIDCTSLRSSCCCPLTSSPLPSCWPSFTTFSSASTRVSRSEGCRKATSSRSSCATRACRRIQICCSSASDLIDSGGMPVSATLPPSDTIVSIRCAVLRHRVQQRFYLV